MFEILCYSILTYMEIKLNPSSPFTRSQIMLEGLFTHPGETQKYSEIALPGETQFDNHHVRSLGSALRPKGGFAN